MDISKLVLLDPKTKEPSWTFTMMVLAFVQAFTLSILVAASAVANGGMSLEILASSAALYYGRRNLSFGGKTASAGEDANAKTT
jgi:hypothetical protein